MKQIKAVAKKIKDQNALIEGIRADIARCNDTIARGAGSDGSSEIGSLREKRRDVIAQAYIKGAQPDTAEIDAQIEKLIAERSQREQEIAVLRMEQQAAKDARVILSKQLDEATQAREALNAERMEAAAEFLLAKHDEAQQRYFEAVAALREPIEQMAAAERAWRIALAGRAFPERGAEALADIRERGIRVTWEHSALRDPAVAAGYTDNFREAWYVPEWADARNESFAEQSTAALIGDLKSVGLDVTMPVPEVKTVEPQVEIEVVRGTIGGVNEGAKLDPVSGERVKGQPVTYGPGSRLKLPESEAAQHVSGGFARYTSAIDAERAEQARRHREDMRHGRGEITVHKVALTSSQRMGAMDLARRVSASS
ncbi:hypothetical protein WI90_27235 [Burkholderia ubonensis]|uniref:hypothetical protein n=1 Tax=Burkholderia ubonensis TaxID=101571 RepID=UPI00075961F2|nr:hypothetical protein [Burkholderia ubonensis]KVD85369.1 hypothetical protein WI90_27235 [Burkholderia ubonensis]